MAIARDTSGKATSTGTSTNLNLTLAAGATLLIGVGVLRNGNNQNISGMTWNGVAMTQLATDSPKTYTYSGDGKTYGINLFYMFSPTTGLNTMTVSASSNPGGADLDIYGVSYTGTGLSIGSQTSASGTSSPLSTTLTTTGSGAWTFLCGTNESSVLSASTGSTLIQSQHGSAIFDSNGIVSGSTNMQATFSGGTGYAGIMISFAIPPAFLPRLNLLGVG